MMANLYDYQTPRGPAIPLSPTEQARQDAFLWLYRETILANEQARTEADYTARMAALHEEYRARLAALD